MLLLLLLKKLFFYLWKKNELVYSKTILHEMELLWFLFLDHDLNVSRYL